MGLTRRWLWAAGWWLCAWLAWPAAAWAHIGAPYPVLMEQPAGPYSVSALADPDVGTGTFYMLVALAAGGPAPEGTRITLWVQPEDGHRPAASVQAERQETRYGERFVAKVPFDAKGAWQVRLLVQGPAGGGEAAFPVQVTPSGIGWLGTVACLIPFLLLGALWLRAALRPRTAPRREGDQA